MDAHHPATRQPGVASQPLRAADITVAQDGRCKRFSQNRPRRKGSSGREENLCPEKRLKSLLQHLAHFQGNICSNGKIIFKYSGAEAEKTANSSEKPTKKSDVIWNTFGVFADRSDVFRNRFGVFSSAADVPRHFRFLFSETSLEFHFSGTFSQQDFVNF